MKIYEAIAMLEQMDQNKECTVTFGNPVRQHRDEYVSTDAFSPYLTKFVIGKESWPSRNEVTCKMH